MHGCIKRFNPFVFLSLLLIVQEAGALSKEVEQLVQWETKSNAVALRSADPISLEHYEIPLEKVQKDFASNLDDLVRDALVFEKDGKEHVRWIINPEDTQWHLELKDYLAKEGLDTNTYQYFTGYQTASRSMIVEGPDKKISFSVKVSTNKTGGYWKDKKQPIDDAQQIRMVSDMVEDVKERVKFKHAIFQDEPLQLGVTAVNQALIVRSLAMPKEGGRYYIPGFSVMHEVAGKEIAKLNGSLDPVSYWNENYNKPLARSLAEFAAYFGMSYDSPHSQNFLVELDEKMKPTGRIVLRDFGDAYVVSQKLIAMGKENFVKSWEQSNIKSGNTIPANVGIMHGNDFASWISEKQYREWGQDFVSTYREEFASLLGMKVEDLGLANSQYMGRYLMHKLELPDEAWQNYLKLTRCFQGYATLADGSPCPSQLKNRIIMKSVGAPDRCSGLLKSLMSH